MSDTAQMERARSRDVEAELNYIAAGIELPRTYTYPPPDGEPRTTIVNEAHRVPIRDARALAADATLDREGFARIHFTTTARDFDDDAEIRGRLYPEAEQTLRFVTGAARIFIFDHTVRRRVEGAQDRGPGAPRQPVPRVHVDHTVDSGPQRVRDLLPDEADELLCGRVQVINLWRPLVGPLRDFPLAVADARSIASEELVPSSLIYPNRVGETYSVRYNPRHRWFYLPDMQPDEALLLKCFDSATDGRARFTPHTAFQDPTAPADVRPRESIELRALVFHPS
jgi:hypothetical protein